MVQGVFSLPPGHSLKIRADEPLRSAQPKSYWDFAKDFSKLADAKHKSAAADSAAAASAVRSLLEDSVRGHLIADVPIGVFLSSGLDSTVIAALASQVQKGVHTFTVAFPDSEFSEAEIARAHCAASWHRTQRADSLQRRDGGAAR